MSPVTETQVSNLFKTLDINKSSVNIPNKLMKLAAEPLSIPFTQIYNQSIETGIAPDMLKARVYKNGDVTAVPGNYRPISTLSPFSKVLEGLIYNHLYSFLEKHDILYKYQFGFRKGYSTEQAVLEITGTLEKAMVKKMVTCGLYLDFQRHLKQSIMVLRYLNSIIMQGRSYLYTHTHVRT